MTDVVCVSRVAPCDVCTFSSWGVAMVSELAQQRFCAEERETLPGTPLSPPSFDPPPPAPRRRPARGAHLIVRSRAFFSRAKQLATRPPRPRPSLERPPRPRPSLRTRSAIWNGIRSVLRLTPPNIPDRRGNLETTHRVAPKGHGAARVHHGRGTASHQILPPQTLGRRTPRAHLGRWPLHVAGPKALASAASAAAACAEPLGPASDHL